MVGMLGHIGLGKETTWGTAVAATDYYEALSESVIAEIERYETRNIYAGFYEADDSDGMRRYAGDIVMPVNPRNIGHWLLGGLGVNSVSVVLSGVMFTNAMGPIQSLVASRHPLPPYTLEVFRPDAFNTASSFRYAGAQIAKLSLNLKPNQEARLTASIIAQDGTLITKTTPTFPTSPVQFFTFDQSSLQLGGAAVDRFEDITVEIDNQIEGIPTLDNSTTINRVRRTGPQLIRLSGTVGFDNFTDFLSFRNQTEQRLVLSMFRANSFALVVDAPRMVFTEMPVQIGGRERITVDFAAMARFHTGSNMALRVSLTTTNTY